MQVIEFGLLLHMHLLSTLREPTNISLLLNGTLREDNTTFWQGHLIGSAGLSGNSGN